MSDALADYVRDIADRMILRDWTVFASNDPGERPEDAKENASGCFVATEGRRDAALWIDPIYWQGEDREDVRQTIVHELIHAHLDQSRQTIGKILGGAFPARTGAILMALYDDQMEYATDALADVIAPFLPLPPEIPA